MGRIIDDYLPVMAMVGLQFCYSGNALFPRAALVHGMNPRVFVVYRQAISTLAIAPLAYFSRRNSRGVSMGLKSFWLIFLASLIGVTINQNIYFEGLYLASSSIASAMANLIPAITFLLASIVGMEKIDIWSLRTVAKIAGTVLCVGGAIGMALLKGPKLLNANVFGPANESWLLGCSLLFGNACCWSIWLILQVPINYSYPDPLSSSAWMCFLATIQSATLALVMEQEPRSWILHSYFELFCCLFSGIVGSALAFIVQAWCISKRGPLFSAMFNPLSTVIVTFFAALFLHEEIYTGSVIRGCKETDEGMKETDGVNDSGKLHIYRGERPPKVVIVGSGPAGLFASLVLAELGADVTLIERGQPVEQRGRDIGALVVRRILERESNFCFGEVLGVTESW